MKGFSFPLCKTKLEGSNQRFDLADPADRKKYFALKASREIKTLQEYLQNNTFIGFLIGPKNSGKGTYAKLFAEAVGSDRIRHISIGDIVRNVHNDVADEARKRALITFLETHYRGLLSLEEAFDALLGRSTAKLLPTEFILALVQYEISRLPKEALFIDGFPRDLDQISYALYFRALMGYRDDPDFFVFIDVPESVIDERMKYRVVCPKCQTPRNIKLMATKEVGYDASGRGFFLKCDNPECNGVAMVPKEGDDLGIEAIRDRIEADDKVMQQLLQLQGISKIYLRNTVPVDRAKEYIDDYEITPVYRYAKEGERVKIIEEPWIVNDDGGIPSYSLLPPPIVVSLMKQIVEALHL